MHLTFSCRAVIDGMHRQAGDAQRGRAFEAVHPQGGGEHERQERNRESRSFGGGLVFGFFAGPEKEHGRWRRRCPLRERLREKEKIIAYSKTFARQGTCRFRLWLRDVFLSCRFGVGSVVGWCLGGYNRATCVEARYMNGR